MLLFFPYSDQRKEAKEGRFGGTVLIIFFVKSFWREKKCEKNFNLLSFLILTTIDSVLNAVYVYHGKFSCSAFDWKVDK